MIHHIDWKNVVIVDRNKTLSEEIKNDLDLLNNNNSTYINGYNHNIIDYLEFGTKNFIILTCDTVNEIADVGFYCRTLIYSKYSVSLIIICPAECVTLIESASIDGVEGLYTSDCSAEDIMNGLELIAKGYSVRPTSLVDVPSRLMKG